MPLRRLDRHRLRSRPGRRPAPPSGQRRPGALPGQEPRPQPSPVLQRLRCRPRSSPPSASPTTSCRGWSGTNSSPTTSRSSTPRRMRSSASRRWRAGTIRPKDVLAPNDFIKIAEELNVVATIDRMILEQTLHDFNDWAASGLKVPKASVNVSARRLHDEELIRSLRPARHQAGHDLLRTGGIDLPRRERRTGHLERRADQGSRHRHRDRRFRHRLRLDRQPAQAEAAPAEDRPAAGHADPDFAGAAPSGRLDHRDRQVARHRGAGRRRRDDSSMRAC